MLIRAWPVLTCSVCVVCHFLFSPLIGRAFSFFRSSFPTHGRCNWPGYCMRCILRWVPHCVPRCIPAKEIPTAWKAARIAHPSTRVPRGRALNFRVMALSFELTVLQKILYWQKSPNVCGPKQTGNDLCRSCWVLQGHSSEASVFDVFVYLSYFIIFYHEVVLHMAPKQLISSRASRLRIEWSGTWQRPRFPGTEPKKHLRTAWTLSQIILDPSNGFKWHIRCQIMSYPSMSSPLNLAMQRRMVLFPHIVASGVFCFLRHKPCGSLLVVFCRAGRSSEK